MISIKTSNVLPSASPPPSPTAQCSHCYHQDTTGICQSFDISTFIPEDIPTQQQLDQPLCAPIPSDPIIFSNSSVAQSLQMTDIMVDSLAPVERLPTEIFAQIMSLLAVPAPASGYTSRNKNISTCLLVSRTFHYHTLATLYAHATFPRSMIFSKFLSNIQRYPQLGELVRRADFSTFTSIGLGRTMRENIQIQRLTATTLQKCLALTPKLQEFLASESIGMDMDAGVLQKLFCDLQYLRALDLCALAHPDFLDGMAKVLVPTNPLLPEKLPIKRLGLHGCTTLNPSCISTLLPRLPFLTHLDLTHTLVTDSMLQMIPKTARLSHLSLSRCNRLKGPAVVDFLTEHPAAKNLVFLNLLYESSRYRLLSVNDVDKLLPRLPSSLKSLNLSGAKVTAEHVPELRRLAKHLEELSIGHADLSSSDICTILEPGVADDEGNKNPQKHTLRFLDLTGISSVDPAMLLYTPNCNLLLPSSYPLQVIELSAKVVSGLNDRKISGKKLGWIVRDKGNRGWYVRAEAGVHPGGGEVARKCLADDGERSWKMGGKWWGNRKVECAYGEIGGIYGYYGFGN